MNRRQIITALGGAAAWPLAARAQQPERMRRLGVLSNGEENAPQAKARQDAFRKGLGALGWVEGRNIRIDYRYFAGNPDLARDQAAELVALAPDVILSQPTGLPWLQQMTRTIPVVFVVLLDPVGEGFVASLARPGGNMTGFAAYDPSINTKYLQLLKQVAPGISRVAFMYDPSNPGLVKFSDAEVAAGPSLGLKVYGAPVHTRAEVQQSIEALVREPNGALHLANNGPIVDNLELILALATRHRLPTMGAFRYFPTVGALMSYGFDDVDQFRQGASYVDRILKGANPAELPVQYPTKYELVINLKTARELGLEISPTLLSLADDLVE
jgi:putative tryptophan/tyrosine transport system substrate-binding protein